MASLTRRSLLKSLLGAGAVAALPRLARAERDVPSLLVLWLAGGASQLETWDPHERVSTCGVIPTLVPGLEISSWLPRMAERMHHVSVVRSLVSKEGDHARGTYAVKTGYTMNPTVKHPSLGALLTKMAPVGGSGLPPYVSLGRSSWPGTGGHLGPAYDAFVVPKPGVSLHDLAAPVDEPRQERRLQNLEIVSESFSKRMKTAAHSEHVGAALAMMRSEDLAAFDVEEEPEDVVDRYGEHDFGRACLVARRLVERGVRAVEVTLDGFDSHANNHEAHATRVPVLDAALSALLDDLVARDLLRRTLVVVISEMGRTPRINALDGRDHWPNGFSCVLGGAGIGRGRVIGSTSPDDGTPKDVVTVEDLGATILAGLGLEPTKSLVTKAGRPVPLSRGRVERRLLRDS